MILKDLLLQVTKEDVIKTIIEHYPDQEPYSKDYDTMYDSLLDMPFEKDEDDYILLVNPEYDYFVENSVHTAIHAYSRKKDIVYDLDFVPWKNWLGIEVCKKSLEVYGVVSLVAHCLREMSVVSFDEDFIQKTMQDLKDIEKEIEDGTVETYTMEQVCDNLGISLPKSTPEEDEERRKKIREIMIINEKIVDEFIKEYKEI